jgi:DNA polymerase-3 subunit delta
MIIKELQINEIIERKEGFFGMLVYGPNEGLVREKIEQITKNQLVRDEYEQISFDAGCLDDEPNKLEDLSRTVSMFHKYKIIIVNSLKDKHIKIIEDIADKLPARIILIVKLSNLKKSSKIRKFFEDNNSCYSLACYEDDDRSIIKKINEFEKQYEFVLNKDIKNYLLQTLSNDRMISNNELEKIILLYKSSSNEIKLADIKTLLNDSSSNNMNKMNETVMYGKTMKSSIIVNKILSQGNNPISLIRSLLNYVARMRITKIEMQKGKSFEDAIHLLKPPVFWKEKNDFKSHCINWSIRSIEKCLSDLLEAEVACKLNSKLAKIECEKSILFIANNGKHYF